MKIVYFAPDLDDAATVRRVCMLKAGGAEVSLLGFRRNDTPIKTVEGIEAIDLGRVFDGKLGRRIGLVLRRMLEAGRYREMLVGADALLARNLDMATIADAARERAGLHIPLIYECLDVHQALLGGGMPSKVLRGLEARILKRSAALVVSSPGFVTNYFERLHADLPRIIIAENKRVVVDAKLDRPVNIAKPPPWKIGWFGIIRCATSFQILRELAQRQPLIDVEISGRPTEEVQSLINEHLPLSNMRFSGPYTQSDLFALYGNSHFAWAIDYFQKGQNSEWLLPNRIYEGGFYNCPAIALAGTETAKWLTARNAGLIIKRDPSIELEIFLKELNVNHYRGLKSATMAIPIGDLIDNIEDCRSFTNQLVGCHSIDSHLASP
jgi:succinoglycan biosynthesis protein ExoL